MFKDIFLGRKCTNQNKTRSLPMSEVWFWRHVEYTQMNVLHEIHAVPFLLFQSLLQFEIFN